MPAKLQLRYKVKGMAFGARDCDCPCDPCDCDPCECERPGRPVRWRVSGYHIETGTIDGSDVSDMLLLSLSQAAGEGSNAPWQEIVLIDERATAEQISTLLDIFRDHLKSMPAEITAPAATRKAVYALPMSYTMGADGPRLHVEFAPERARLVQDGAPRQTPPAWRYDGPMALREHFTLSST
ncbi:MAG: DUF1326 domain-containing protein [Ktedonobacteraceae bacterium]|nr:DUF1326 domain-containing protein [Ktedonobacteraceae bacterium]